MKSFCFIFCLAVLSFATFSFAEESAPIIEEEGASNIKQAPTVPSVVLEKNSLLKSGDKSTETGVGYKVGGLTSWPIVFFTLFGIIALIFLMGWGARRMGGLSAMGMRSIKVLSAMPVGTKEKVALIDVNGQQFLIGVTSQNINHLHTFETPIVEQSSVKESEFSSKLQSILKSANGGASSKKQNTDPDASKGVGESKDA